MTKSWFYNLNDALYIKNGRFVTLHVHHLMYETNHFLYTAHYLMYQADPLLIKLYYLTYETKPLIYKVIKG